MEILNSNINVVVQPHRKTPCLDFDFKEMNFHFYNSAEQKQCAIKGLCHVTACVVQTPTALLHWWNYFEYVFSLYVNFKKQKAAYEAYKETIPGFLVCECTAW